MSLEPEMKPNRTAMQTLVELRITPLNLARVGKPTQLPSTNLSLTKRLCVLLKQKGKVANKERAANNKRYKRGVPFAKQVALQFLQVPHMPAAKMLI